MCNRSMETLPYYNEKPADIALVEFTDPTGLKQLKLPLYKLADRRGTLYTGARVVAIRSKYDLPYTINELTGLEPLYSSDDNDFYPGIIAALSDKDPEYCVIFFDDGHVQAVVTSNIRAALDSDCMEHGEFDSLDILVLIYKIGQVVSVELNGEWIPAKVKEIELPLAQFCFMQDNQPD